jgi:WD40 repeat protein
MHFEEALMQRDQNLKEHIAYINELHQIYSTCSQQKHRIDELERERVEVLELRAKCLSLTEERSELQMGQATNWSKMLELNEKIKSLESSLKKTERLSEELRTLMEEKDKFIIYLKGKLALQPAPITSLEIVNEFEQIEGNKVTKKLQVINNVLDKGILREKDFFGFSKDGWGFYLNDKKLPFPNDHVCEKAGICIAMSENFAIASINTIIVVWGLKSERIKYTFSGHTKIILDLSISEDEKFLVSGQSDLIKIWDLQSGGLTRSITANLDSQCMKLFIYESTIVTVLLSRGKIKTFEFDGKLIKNLFINKGELVKAFIFKDQLFIDCGQSEGIRNLQMPSLKLQGMKKIEHGFVLLGVVNNSLVSYEENEGVLLINDERYLIREKGILSLHGNEKEMGMGLLLGGALLQIQFK